MADTREIESRILAFLRSENIEIIGSHCGMGFNPVIYYVIADRLTRSGADFNGANLSDLSREEAMRVMEVQVALQDVAAVVGRDWHGS